MTDFDKIIGRRETGSLKWDKYKDGDVIPMWVADMDFQAPPAVIEALRKRIEHGIFGYSVPTDELNDTIVRRLKQLYGWQIEPSWIVWLPGLVFAVDVVSRCVDSDKDIITFIPAYPPFLEAPAYANRKLITVPLLFKDNRYTLDVEKFKKAISPDTKLFILCNPYNPVGRVFSREELKVIADICLRHNIIICSDEIHCELILGDKKHIPTASLNGEIENRTITLMSPAKTFNLAGLNCGFAVIPNPDLRGCFIYVMRGIAPPCVNVLGLAACQAAYSDCEEWKKALLKYLAENKEMVYEFVNNKIPLLSMADVEATYLAWINAQKLDVTDPAAFFEKAGVGLFDGRYFGAEGFVRLNFGCPRKILSQGLERMKKAVEKYLASNK